MTSAGSNTIRSRKLPAASHHVIMPLVLSVVMTCIVSGISTWHVLGVRPDFIAQWAGAWGLSWAIAFPTLLLVLPLVRRFVAAVVEPGSGR